MKRLGWKIYKRYGKFSKINIIFKTKKFGYLNLTWGVDKSDRYFYISPNNAIWASTYYKGPNTDVAVKAFIRKNILGHNYDVQKKHTVLMEIDAAFYSSEEYFMNRYKASHRGLV